MFTKSALLPDLPELSDARRRLYEAALVLFGDKSYDSVSVRDVANSLGQQPGALYAHVPSKQHLLFELVKIGHDAHRDRLKAALLDAGRDPIDQVRALATAHVLIHLEFQSLARVTNRELRALNETQQAALLEIRTASEGLFIDVIERGRQLGVFNPVNEYLAVTAIAAMGVRAAEWWRSDSTLTPAHIAETYSTFAVRLLT